MVNFGCLWNRPRLERFADSALGAGAARRVSAHVSRCGECQARLEQQRSLARLIQSAVTPVAEPDWNGFWPGVKARIARETPRPIRDPWWIPLWKPFWGHPRLAIGGAMAATLAVVLSLSLWPASDGQMQAAFAAPVVVQDVGTPDPDRSVMVYSTPDSALTVIWLFDSGGTTDES